MNAEYSLRCPACGHATVVDIKEPHPAAWLVGCGYCKTDFRLTPQTAKSAAAGQAFNQTQSTDPHQPRWMVRNLSNAQTRTAGSSG